VLEAALGLTMAPAPWYVVLSVAAVTVPVAWMRRSPAIALVVLLAAMVGQAALGSDIGGGFAEPIALICLLYAVASRLSVSRSLALVAVALLALTAVLSLGDDDWHAGNLFYAATVVGVAWAFGQGGRLASEHNALLAERAALLERESAHEAEAAAQAERARIARELHDVVSHNISAIVVQAGAERRELANGPASVATTLADIEEHGRQTLQELRRLLGVLRVGEDAGMPVAPQPGLADLPRLIESNRSSGVEVTLTSCGEARPVSRGLELAVYRVVQEGLTNVRKHAGGAAASVTLRWAPDRLEVAVRNGDGDQEHRELAGAGAGLRGVRERVEAYGGRVLQAGPTGDGFQVHVAIPIGAAG
jgi:signal transduction histidine kinase